MANKVEKPKKKIFGWLDTPKSGKKTSGVLWVLTFAVTFVFSMFAISFNFILSMEDKPILIDSTFLQNWVEFIKVWIYGLIWFSGFIAVGSTVKSMKKDPKAEADIFFEELKKIQPIIPQTVATPDIIVNDTPPAQGQSQVNAAMLYGKDAK